MRTVLPKPRYASGLAYCGQSNRPNRPLPPGAAYLLLLDATAFYNSNQPPDGPHLFGRMPCQSD